jgi:DNA polymerase
MRKEIEKEFLSIIESVEAHLAATSGSGVTELPRLPAGMTPLSRTSCKDLREIREWIGDCKRCKLHTGRKQIVFGAGNPSPDLLFIGEGPGAEEDEQGIPFVGRAGQLLTKMIEAMGLNRDQVYIANVVKCRPPGNRNPEPDEISACSPFLENQIEVLRPKVICTLGTFASQTLLKTGQKISNLRGRFHVYKGIPVMPTFHPAYLLRNPSEKKSAWEDIQLIMKELHIRPGPAKEGKS